MDFNSGYYRWLLIINNNKSILQEKSIFQYFKHSIKTNVFKLNCFVLSLTLSMIFCEYNFFRVYILGANSFLRIIHQHCWELRDFLGLLCQSEDYCRIKEYQPQDQKEIQAKRCQFNEISAESVLIVRSIVVNVENRITSTTHVSANQR